MSESTSGMTDLEQLIARHDERPEARTLLNALKRNQTTLSQLLVECDEGSLDAEDCIYRFYHGSRKVYWIQELTEQIATRLQQQMPDRPLNPLFAEILQQGTGLEPERRQPERRAKATRHMLEAYFHAHYFLEMAVKYGRELEYPPCLMPSGWAALLYLYNLRLSKRRGDPSAPKQTFVAFHRNGRGITQTMKRRTFIQSIGAAGVLGVGEQQALAKVSGPNASVQTLTPVVERLPEALAEFRAEQRTLQASMAASAAERSDDAFGFALALEHYDCHSYPLLIGLGARAECVLDTIHTAGNLPLDAGLYRTGNQRPQQAPNWLAQRLQKTAAVMLLIDPDDPAARADARVWALYLQEADIDLKAALVLEAQDAGFDPSWRSELGLTVIDVRAGDGGLETTTLVRALLPCLLFQQIALIGVDLADICSLIASGSRAWTTAVHVRAPDDVTVALARAFANLPSIRTTGAMIWVTSGRDYSLREFDAIIEALHQWTGDPITFLHAPSFDDRYAEGERLLSLTLFSD